jgi:GxxExxY protein
MNENEVARIVVDTAYKVHKLFGPGLFESVYEELMEYELKKVFPNVRRQYPVALMHEEIYIPVAFRADLIVDNKVLIELKSVEAISRVDFKQVRTYLHLTGYKLGLLINFNVELIKDGIRRIVNGLEDDE